MRGSWALGVTGVLVGAALLAGCEDGSFNGRMDCCAAPQGYVYRNLWCEDPEVKAPEAMCEEEENGGREAALALIDRWKARQSR
jgi:hypothetical protein